MDNADSIFPGDLIYKEKGKRREKEESGRLGRREKKKSKKERMADA